VSDVINEVQSKTGRKISFQPIQQQNCRDYLNLRNIQLPENKLPQVDFNKMEGDWELRQTSRWESKYIFSWKRSFPRKNSAIGIRYKSDGTVHDKVIFHPIPDTKQIYYRTTLTGEGRVLLIYADYKQIFLAYYYDQLGPYLNLFARPGVEHDVRIYQQLYKSLEQSIKFSLVDMLIEMRNVRPDRSQCGAQGLQDGLNSVLQPVQDVLGQNRQGKNTGQPMRTGNKWQLNDELGKNLGVSL